MIYARGTNRRLGTQLPALEFTRTVEWWFAWVISLGAFAVIVARALRATDLADFSYILVAGQMWRAGLDPYASGFVATGTGLLPPDAIPFAYPPNWWIIATSLAAFKPESAFLVWKLISLSAAAAATALLISNAARIHTVKSLWPISLFVLCIFASDITGYGLRLGQTSLIVLLGFSILTVGHTNGRRAPQIVGLSILMLKPQIGLLFFALMFAKRETRLSACLAIVVTVCACLPVLFTLGVEATIRSGLNLLNNLDLYGMSPWNSPMHTSGLPHILAYFGATIHPAATLLAAFSVTVWLVLRNQETDRSRILVRLWLSSVASLLAFVPLHAYDFILLFTCLLLLPALEKGASRNLLLLALALTWLATLVAFRAFLADPSSDGFWMAVRLKYDLLTAGGLALLGAAICHSRARQTNSQQEFQCTQWVESGR